MFIYLSIPLCPCPRRVTEGVLSPAPAGVECWGQDMLWAQEDPPTPAGCSGIQQLGAGWLSPPSRSLGTGWALVTCRHCLTRLHPRDTTSCKALGLALERGGVVLGRGAASSTSTVLLSSWDICAQGCLCSLSPALQCQVPSWSQSQMPPCALCHWPHCAGGDH